MRVVRVIRTVLMFLFMASLVAGMLGGTMMLFCQVKAGLPLFGLGLVGLVPCIVLDFFFSWLERSRPEPRGFEVKLVPPAEGMKDE